MNKKGYTLVESVVAAAIISIVCGAFAGLVRYTMVSSTKIVNQSQSQEQVRIGLMRLEDRLAHANRVLVASTTYVQYISDLDQSPNYDAYGDLDGDGTPNLRDADRDGDANLIASATAQWQIGFNLKDDDEDGDGKIDVRERIYLSTRSVVWEISLNEGNWTRRKELAVRVSTFTLTYYGNKANALGRLIDANSDGVIMLTEMDGAGNANGKLDQESEQEYVTSIRITMGVDWNNDGVAEYRIETDVYPILLPLKPDSY